MFAHKNLSYKFCAEEVNIAIYILNICPTKVVENKTLFKAQNKRKPEVNTLRIF